MTPTHFHLQGQPWQLHNNVGNLHVERPHSTMFLPTTQLIDYSKNIKQQHCYFPQYITHIMIIHLHWCFRHQGDILSVNPTLLSALDIGIGGHLDEAMYTDR